MVITASSAAEASLVVVGGVDSGKLSSSSLSEVEEEAMVVATGSFFLLGTQPLPFPSIMAKNQEKMEKWESFPTVNIPIDDWNKGLDTKLTLVGRLLSDKPYFEAFRVAIEQFMNPGKEMVRTSDMARHIGNNIEKYKESELDDNGGRFGALLRIRVSINTQNPL
ncbi:hypothetical protein Salat_1901600 [Sesamum alatum]|uniref:Uncharacterized protein n=1 Tax=Sesamum alatum TaxID=300844 RepID=A0AAE1Y3X1_9LAMI|nr:hypothetical protein Salat_1901600 [Sesamum alatum]